MPGALRHVMTSCLTSNVPKIYLGNYSFWNIDLGVNFGVFKGKRSNKIEIKYVESMPDALRYVMTSCLTSKVSMIYLWNYSLQNIDLGVNFGVFMGKQSNKIEIKYVELMPDALRYVMTSRLTSNVSMIYLWNYSF